MASWWSEPCPKRGAALGHAHWARCDPSGVHPRDDSGNSGRTHLYNMCCHCEQTEAMAREADIDIAMSNAALVDPDSLPLALPQNGCETPHAAFVREKLDHDGEWASCPTCLSPLEPKLATGMMVGPSYGPGRGWVSPRMKLRWLAISYRAMRDDESSLKPVVP